MASTPQHKAIQDSRYDSHSPRASCSQIFTIPTPSFPDSSVGKESACNAGDPSLIPGWENPLKKRQATRSSTFGLFGLPCCSAGKESACSVGDLGSISGLGRSPGEGRGYPLQYSGLENSMDCLVHGVAKSQTRLRDFHFHQLILTEAYMTNKTS